MELVSRFLEGTMPSGDGEPPRRWFSGRVTQDDRITRLEEVDLLSSCTRRQLKAIARISEVVEAPAATVLARVGDPGDAFYLLMDGSARVDVSPRKRVRLRPGDYFGEMSLLDGEPRSATVTAETPVRLLAIRRRDFATLLRSAPDLTENLLATLSRRVRQAERAPES